MFSDNEKNGFFDAVESLKKYRRADLIDEDGRNLLEQLYTDLLPNDHILKKSLKDNTTFLIGRKGTGKSTIFLRLEQELRKKRNYLSCYLDVKTIFESSQTEYTEISYLKNYFPPEILNKYLIERTFIQNTLSEIQKEIALKTDTLINKIASIVKKTKPEIVQENLDEIKSNITNNEILQKIEIPVLQQYNISNKSENEKLKEREQGISNPKISAGISDGNSGLTFNSGFSLNSKDYNKSVQAYSNSFSRVFLQIFQIKETILKIKEILTSLDIRHLVIMLDDFSEIEEDSIKTFVDVILAPLNNWSDEFIKFKIAAYPHRVYYGKIDPGKVDMINLDFFNLYSEFNRDRMEENACDFTKRIISKRVEHFTNSSTEIFFDTNKSTIEEYYELLFQVSMNVPRILGYILSYCYQSSIIYNKQITKSDIEAASERYFEEKMKPFFDTTTLSLLSIGEKISILQLNELLDEFGKALLEIKKRIQTNELKGSIYQTNYPFSSHFHFDPRLEEFLKTLELNFFISKYNEMSDKDGKPVSVYSIYYGYARKLNLLWGKPEGALYRKYFIERPFHFTKLIQEFLSRSKFIHCINPSCNKNFSAAELDYLKFTNFKCNNCGAEVIIESISDELQSKLEKIDRNKLLPVEEIRILKELEREDSYVYAREIAEELDLSKYLIAFRCRKLAINYNYVDRNKEHEGDPYKYKLTESGKEYFISFSP
jgi:hypothetical protein